jgi:hypothetical protein
MRLGDRARRSSIQTTCTSPTRKNSRAFINSGRSRCAPDGVSWKMRSHPALVMESVCKSVVRSPVETRAHSTRIAHSIAKTCDHIIETTGNLKTVLETAYTLQFHPECVPKKRLTNGRLLAILLVWVRDRNTYGRFDQGPSLRQETGRRCREEHRLFCPDDKFCRPPLL